MLILQALKSGNSASAQIYVQCLRKGLLPHFQSKSHSCIHTKAGIQSNLTASSACHLSLTRVNTLVSFSPEFSKRGKHSLRLSGEAFKASRLSVLLRLHQFTTLPRVAACKTAVLSTWPWEMAGSQALCLTAATVDGCAQATCWPSLGST